MKLLITIVFTVLSVTVFCQNKPVATDEFVISGAIKKEIVFNVSGLEKMPSVKIGDVDITNHLGEKKGTATNLSGIAIKNLLKDIEFTVESPKQMSEFYFVFIASDNYKVVFSWNEIFNSATGDNVFLVTSKDGKKLSEMDDRLLTITKTDFKTGRRYVKGLSKIVVQRAQ